MAQVGGCDYRAYVGPAERYDLMSSSQFSLLCALGLRESHRLLDIGCGSLRGGRLFIPCLAPGGYTGLEPNRWLVEEGIEKHLGRDALAVKEPTFIYNDSFDEHYSRRCAGRWRRLAWRRSRSDTAVRIGPRRAGSTSPAASSGSVTGARPLRGGLTRQGWRDRRSPGFTPARRGGRLCTLGRRSRRTFCGFRHAGRCCRFREAGTRGADCCI